MAPSDELEALAKRHGALSYRNRADTQNPAFGFSEAGLASLLAEVHKQDETLIRQLVGALEDFDDAGPIGEGWKAAQLLSLLASARARLEGKK